jgi:hypothetical protein
MIGLPLDPTVAAIRTGPDEHRAVVINQRALGNLTANSSHTMRRSRHDLVKKPSIGGTLLAGRERSSRRGAWRGSLRPIDVLAVLVVPAWNHLPAVSKLQAKPADCVRPE